MTGQHQMIEVIGIKFCFRKVFLFVCFWFRVYFYVDMSLPLSKKQEVWTSKGAFWHEFYPKIRGCEIVTLPPNLRLF